MRVLVNQTARVSILFLLGGAWCGCSSPSGDARGSGGNTTLGDGAGAHAGGTNTSGASGGAAGLSASAGGNAGGGGSAGTTTNAGNGGTSSAGGSSGGTSVGGASGSGGATTTPRNCAGNAVSLSSNGTGTDSDAARARVELDLGVDLPIGNAPRTLEFWLNVKPTDWLGEKNEIYVYGSPGTTNTAFGLDFGTNAVTGVASNHATLNPYTNGNFTVDSTSDLGIDSSATQWLHVAMTWDGTSFVTYVNGAPKISKTNAGGMLATTASVLTLGCNPPINNCFNGDFDELRVWNIARSAADIAQNYEKPLTGNESGLVGYFKFDEAPGATTLADSVSTSGHTPHSGHLLANDASKAPTLITPQDPPQILCN